MTNAGVVLAFFGGLMFRQPHVTDADRFQDYLARDKIAFDKFDARFLVRGGRCEAPETPTRSRHVVISIL